MTRDLARDSPAFEVRGEKLRRQRPHLARASLALAPRSPGGLDERAKEARLTAAGPQAARRRGDQAGELLLARRQRAPDCVARGAPPIVGDLRGR